MDKVTFVGGVAPVDVTSEIAELETVVFEVVLLAEVELRTYGTAETGDASVV